MTDEKETKQHEDKIIKSLQSNMAALLSGKIYQDKLLVFGNVRLMLLSCFKDKNVKRHSLIINLQIGINVLNQN